MSSGACGKVLLSHPTMYQQLVEWSGIPYKYGAPPQAPGVLLEF